MAYHEGLAQRIREAIEGTSDVREKRMFGGLAFMIRGHMAFGVIGDELMVRVGPDAYDACVALPHARPMTFTGKALKSMVYVAPAGFAGDADLARWLERGTAFTSAQPAKQAKPAKKKSRARR
jgi:TfoX/Sxy family transcriptional regulator of competence genes